MNQSTIMPHRVLSEEERNAALDYEYFSINYHKTTYGDEVWHASSAPEQELYAAGIFHNYNMRRLLRNARLREIKKGKTLDSPYLDDGMDFLIKRNDPITYHVGQSKYYTKKRIANSDLLGFQRNMVRTRTHGYLYSTTPLEIGMREDLLNSPDWFTHTILKYSPILSVQNNSFSENTFSLRPYQSEAIQIILNKLRDTKNEAKMILQMGCGLGKTLIAATVIQTLISSVESSQQIVICIAPLCISVANLYDRIIPFIRDISVLLVDSDYGGTTDPDNIKIFLENKQSQIIFATFESFNTILIQQFSDHFHANNTFLVVDEAHNLTTELCDIVNTFNSQLLMSATFPEEIKEILDANVIYEYGMARGIQEGNIVDYEVILPLLTLRQTSETSINDENTSSTYVNIDTPNIFIKDDLTSKSLFLIAGMLDTGSRRCIVYLRNLEECATFQTRFRNVCEDYHGIRLWSGTMEYTMSRKERDLTLSQFQMDSSAHDFFIITSVRILDEAIDIPRCDSEFLTHVGNVTSDIRTIQRLQRGGRLDTKNPMKKNHMFIWCENWAPAINALTMVRQEDPNFHKKIRILSGSYDTIGTEIVQKNMLIQTEDINNYIKINCLTANERWNLNFKDLQALCEKEGKLPAERTLIGRWMCNQKACLKRGTMLKERADKFLSVPQLYDWYQTSKNKTEITWDESLENLRKYTEKYGCVPPKKTQLRGWSDNNIHRSVKNLIPKDKIIKLLSIPLIKKIYDNRKRKPYVKPTLWITTFEKFKKEIEANTFIYNTSYPMGRWVNTQIKFIKDDKLETTRKELLLSIQTFADIYNKKINNYKHAIPWCNKFNELKGYIDQNINIKEIYKIMGFWLVNQKYEMLNNKLSKEREELLKGTKVFMDWVEESKINGNKEKISWKDSFTKLTNYIENTKTLPPYNIQEGKWLHCQKGLIMNNKLTKDKKDLLLSVELFNQWYYNKQQKGTRKIPSWIESYQKLLNTITDIKHLPSVGIQSGKWLGCQKPRLLKNLLTEEQRNLLLAIPELKRWYDKKT